MAGVSKDEAVGTRFNRTVYIIRRKAVRPGQVRAWCSERRFGMRLFPITSSQSQQWANILNLIGSVLFVFAAIIPFLPVSGDSPLN